MLFVGLLVVCLLARVDGDVDDPLDRQLARQLGKREAAADGWMESILSLVPGLAKKDKSSTSEKFTSETNHRTKSSHEPYSFSHAHVTDRSHEHLHAGEETQRTYRGRPVPLEGRGSPVYGPNVKPAVQPDNVSELTKLLGGILPNTYYSRPKYRYPYYEQSGKGYLLYGYGDRELYEYSVFKPLEGYF